MLEVEHRPFPRLEDIQRQRHGWCRERHDPVAAARLPRRRRTHSCDIRPRRTELGLETGRLAQARGLKCAAQAPLIRGGRLGLDDRRAHGINRRAPPQLLEYRNRVIFRKIS
jgi:hypothetical protein